MKLGLRCSGTRVHHFRDLLMAIAFDVVQYEDHSRSLGQCCDRPFQVDFHVLPGRPVRAVGRGGVSEEFLFLPSALSGPLILEDRVHREPVEPGAER